jgi:anti-sigma B factor antagonist
MSSAAPVQVGGTEPGFAAILITVSRDGSRLEIAGDLDILTTPRLVDAAACAGCAQDLTIDLTRLVFIDAAGLGGLALMHQQLSNQGRRLCIVGASARVARIFTIGGVAELLHPPVPRPEILDRLTAAVVKAVQATRATP